ncbi:hypothetical protein SK3146_01482 [Paenibacillus konkukensis]|uniref:Uncharacterized protein n=1 Tax=Paenibacillus konkukensis TaxID=2020716 RepID=A0ABY4RJX1_9BACL|nr:hypothetical protein SK3146_01482 [Paenibacillus konkukensis]
MNLEKRKRSSWFPDFTRFKDLAIQEIREQERSKDAFACAAGDPSAAQYSQRTQMQLWVDKAALESHSEPCKRRDVRNVSKASVCDDFSSPVSVKI